MQGAREPCKPHAKTCLCSQLLRAYKELAVLSTVVGIVVCVAPALLLVFSLSLKLVSAGVVAGARAYDLRWRRLCVVLVMFAAVLLCSCVEVAHVVAVVILKRLRCCSLT